MRTKQPITFLFLLLIMLCKSYNSTATHIYGGELLYSHISGNTYRLQLTLYGDCSATPGVFNTLYDAHPLVVIYNSSVFYDTMRLDTVGIQGIDVSPVCPAEIGNTTCSGGTLPGVRKFVYEQTITLPTISPSWRFVFNGSMNISGGGAGRSFQITNIASAGSSIIQLEAKLNNTVGANSSPIYTTIPTPFYCINLNQQYNQGAVDGEGDSLVFSLVPAIDGNSGGSVNYIGVFSATRPLTTEEGSFSFSQLNGQLSFNPSAVQNALVVNQVSEYRNGVLIGTSQREMTFIVTTDCEGTPPTLTIDNINGGTRTINNIINICSGAAGVNFSISIDNPDGDTTEIIGKNIPTNATLVINNNGTPNPSIYFSWATDTISPGVYTFFLDVKNNHCPIANRQTIAYTINVTPYPTAIASPLSPTNCIHKALVQYDLALGYTPRKLVIRDDANTIVKTYNDSTGTILDSLPAGNYTYSVSSHPQCANTGSFSIIDGGVLPLSPPNINYCVGDASQPLTITPRGLGSIITWYDANSILLPSAPTPSTATPATYRWFVEELYKVCSSGKIPFDVTIHPLPAIAIDNNSQPATICYGDTVFLLATGGVQYLWSPADKVSASADGRPFIRLTEESTIKVITSTEFGCEDSASITYRNIQQCCTFSYPTAFTPNGDGKNDGFKVITYGNMWSYKLAIYNRWGQLVFLSYDPGTYWDGTIYGNTCEIGTYYYFFSGRCQTGNTDEHKGDITLIR